MADKKISALTASTTPLAGTEVLPIVQSSSTVKVSVANLTAGRAVSMLSNTMAAATARNDVDRTGGAGYSYRMKGNDQDNVRFRVENTGGQIYEIVGGNPGASNDGLCILDVTNAAKRLYITSTGDITANTGNLVVGTAGKGIDFSAHTHAAGMTSELLDDYEEGTWVPSVGGNATYTIQEGYYVRVGDLVYVQCQLLLNVLGTGSTTTISGLPFTAFSPSNSSRGTGSVWYCGNLATGVTMLTPGITPAGQDITFGGFPVLGAGTTMSVPLTVFQNGTRVDFSLVYRAN